MFSRFLAVVPSLADSSESVSGQRPNTSVEQGYVTLTLEDYEVNLEFIYQID